MLVYLLDEAVKENEGVIPHYTRIAKQLDLPQATLSALQYGKLLPIHEYFKLCKGEG
jgi:hypothetical protein